MINSNEGTKKAMTKREIIKEISDATELKPDIVKSVLDVWSDIFLREVILNERFLWTKCFSVSSSTRKKRKGFNKKLNKIVEYPETRVLSIKLSKHINYFFRWKMRNENNKKFGVTKENWHEKNETEND